MCEERLTLARQTAPRAIWELHAFTPGSVRFAFTRSLFVYAASRAERGGEGAKLSQAAGLGGGYISCSGLGPGLCRARLFREPAEPFGRAPRRHGERGARGERGRRVRALLPPAARRPRRPRAARERGLRVPPCTSFPASLQPKPLQLLHSTPLPPPLPGVHARLRSVLPSLGSRLLGAPLLPTPQIRRLLETVG